MTNEALLNLFTYHAPYGHQLNRYAALRQAGLTLATLINDLCPESREKSIAITKVQETIQMANAAIAINEK